MQCQCDDTLITTTDHRRLRSLLARTTSSDDARARQLASLRRRVGDARVVGPADVPTNVITMNSLVVLRNLDPGGRLTCRLVYPRQARRSPENVSVVRPLGAVLLGGRVGQIVRWPAGARERRLRIQQVLYQPEAAGDFHLQMTFRRERRS